MRRAISVILFILGGWIVASEVMMSWLDLGEGTSGQFGVMSIMSGVAVPFLLLGMLVSPGNRFSAIGLTLMISVGAGVAVALMVLMMLLDPGLSKVWPPGQPLPQLHIAFVSGVANAGIIGGAGFLCWRFGRSREKKPHRELEQIFGED